MAVCSLSSDEAFCAWPPSSDVI